jgi:hypothetical protein
MAVGKKTNARKFPDGVGPRPDHTKTLREEAKERAAAWSKLSVAEQIAVLNARLGKDVGAKKQRARLMKPNE